MASKKENRSAAVRLKPNAKAAAIVTPAREAPGARAATCAMPINSAWP